MAWVLGLAPVLYLAVRGGGFDIAARSEVELVGGWIVLAGAVAGVLTYRDAGRTVWLAAGLLAAFVAWTGIALAWTSSAEQTVTELGRDAGCLAILLLAVAIVRRESAESLVTGVGVAFGVVTVLAVVSRVQPSLFPSDPLATFLAKSTRRLSYPLHYADGTGNLLALGLPLLLLIATRARTLAGQALGAAVVPLAVLGVVMTASRGGILTAAIGLIAFYALSDERLPKLTTGLVTGIAATVLIAALLHWQGVRNGSTTSEAMDQRHEMTGLIAAVCVVTALSQLLIAQVFRHWRGWRRFAVHGRSAWLASGAIATVAIAAAAATGLPAQLAHQWQVFKQTQASPTTHGNVYNRLTTLSGSHRYQYWSAAAQAYDSKPLTGIGPGTFGFWWAQHGSINEYIRNAHSLYLETLAETGPIGLLLLAGFLLMVLITGIRRALRAPPAQRAVLAGATAAFTGFMTAAAYDWVWQLAVFPAAALLLAAAILADPWPGREIGAQLDRATRWRSGRELKAGPGRELKAGPGRELKAGPGRETQPRPRRGSRVALRVGIAGVGAGCIVAVAIPFALTEAIRSSQDAAGAGNLAAALNDAMTAQQIEPYAATPRLQRALILEKAGDLPGARAAVMQATAREPANWQLWLVRARIDAEDGLAAAAVADYRHAHRLDPLDPSTAE